MSRKGNKQPGIPPIEVTLSTILSASKALPQQIESNNFSEIIASLQKILLPLSVKYPSLQYHQIYLTCSPFLDLFQKYLQTTKTDLDIISSIVLSIPDAVVRTYLFINICIASVHKELHCPNRTLSALLMVVKTVSVPLFRLFILNHLFELSVEIYKDNEVLTVQYLLAHIPLSLAAVSLVLSNDRIPSDHTAPLCSIALRPLRLLSTIGITPPLFRSIMKTLHPALVSAHKTATEFFFLILTQTFQLNLQLVCMPEIITTLTAPQCDVDLKMCLGPFIDKLATLPPEEHYDVINLMRSKIVANVQSALTPANDAALLVVSLYKTVLSWVNAEMVCKYTGDTFAALDIIAGSIPAPTSVQFHICSSLELAMKKMPLMNVLRTTMMTNLVEKLSEPNKKKISRMIIENLQKQYLFLKSFKDAEYILDLVKPMLHPDLNDVDGMNDLSLGLSVFSRITIGNMGVVPLTLKLIDTHIDLALGEIALKSAAEAELRLVKKAHSDSEKYVLFQRLLSRVQCLMSKDVSSAVGLSMEMVLAGESVSYKHSIYFYEVALSQMEMLSDDFLRAECLEKIIGATSLMTQRGDYLDLVNMLQKYAKSIINRPRKCKELLQVVHLLKSGSDEEIKKIIIDVMETAKNCEMECAERFRVEAINHLVWCVKRVGFSDKEFTTKMVAIAQEGLNDIFPQQVKNAFLNAKAALTELNALSCCF
ncbi:hypothetical protein EIN_026000 [Entamoeba invadens IP1]|uniref:hypothetical protein n=1 Tax=Entamoeba invadens IP1 TaxID=370355 RepID=UPI0002C3E437|nr:hypothetical protein EIN_026000 [Entamoeba invadens IP1]ELP90761.1 hypothetical protein EIN_026000 [Entamoeba invadens IP1]|eukprot:XP_004257532.1 hypothetical protein EIN_026000 [Entamoeba invadens IP1]